MTQFLGIAVAKYYMRGNPDNLEASKEKIYNIIKLQRESEGDRSIKTALADIRV